MNGKAQLLVVGAGGLGLWCIQLAKLMFSGKPIAICVAAIDEGKLCSALLYGADSKILWNRKYETNEEFALDINKTGDNGQIQFDAAIDFVGTNNTFLPAYKNLRRGGTIVEVGMYGGIVDIPLIDISKNISIQGNRVIGFSMFSEFLTFLEDKNVNYPPVQLFKLQEINSVLQKLRDATIMGRAVISL